MPTLLLWGNDDKLVPRDYAFAFQQLIPGSKAIVLPECGHLPHVEKGEAFVSELDAFIGEQRVAA